MLWPIPTTKLVSTTVQTRAQTCYCIWFVFHYKFFFFCFIHRRLQVFFRLLFFLFESTWKFLLFALVIYCAINGHSSATLWLVLPLEITLAKVINKNMETKGFSILTCNPTKYSTAYSFQLHLKTWKNHMSVWRFGYFKINLLMILTWTHDGGQFLRAESTADILQDFFFICNTKWIESIS